MKRILIPTDFSANAYNALRYAIKLFNDRPRTFILLNTHLPAGISAEYGINYPVSVITDDYHIESSQHGLEHIISKIMAEFPDSAHNYEAVSSTNLLVDEINNQIAEKHIDLVVMGTQGATGSREIFMGSMTHRVVEKLDTCPILVVPNNMEYKDWGAIAFATNFDKAYEQWQIDPLNELAALNNSLIQIVQVSDDATMNDSQLESLEQLQGLLKVTNHEHHVVAQRDTVEKALRSFLEEMHIDALALIKYKHGFLERLMREPVVKRITFHTDIPLLVLPEDDFFPEKQINKTRS